MNTHETRQHQQRAHEAYRRAARLTGHTVRPFVAVNETIDGDAAFIEVVIRIPREAMEQQLALILLEEEEARVAAEAAKEAARLAVIAAQQAQAR